MRKPTDRKENQRQKPNIHPQRQNTKQRTSDAKPKGSRLKPMYQKESQNHDLLFFRNGEERNDKFFRFKPKNQPIIPTYQDKI